MALPVWLFCFVLWLSNVPVWGFPGRLVVKNPPAVQGCGFDPWVGKISLRRAWQPTLVLLPGKSHGQRSLVGYNPWGGRESDVTEQLDNNSTCFKVYILTGTELVTPCTFLIWVTIIFFSKSVDLRDFLSKVKWHTQREIQKPLAFFF